MIKIREKDVHFRAKQINEVHVLPNADMTEFQAKSYMPGTYMASILFSGREVSWVATKREISINEFIVEA